ncbi:MAG: hypothetical protein K0R26_1992 [Bacteroidota bacterium]|jgi:hypothetical protein|nr:hypothetical protein [Bacteroidota bacterium]
MKFWIYIFIFICRIAVSQDFAKDMDKVYNTYKSFKNFGFNVKYILHENHNINSRIVSQSVGKYVKFDNKTLSVFDENSTLTSGTKIISINHAEKRISILKNTKESYAKTPEFLAQFDTYKKHIEKISLLNSSDNNVLYYSVELKRNNITGLSKYEVVIDKTKSYIIKMTLFYSRKLEKDENYKVEGTEVPRLDILFTEINDKKLFNLNEFSDQYYYSKLHGKIMPSSNFKNYNIKENI